jgi:hypothetical protein
MFHVRGAKPVASGRACRGTDDIGQEGNGFRAWYGESVAEIIPECDFELGASLEKTEEGVAAVATDIAAGAAAELASGDVTADVVSEPLVCSGISG